MEVSPRERITLNISGEIFETWAATLGRFPRTLLGDPTKRNSFFCFNTNQYFFNRNRAAFEGILYFYQSNGRLSRPSNVGFETFESECKYFELPDVAIKEMKLKEGMFISKGRKQIPSSNLQGIIWKFVERPESSRAAKAFAIFSLSMILLSVIIACLESIPDVQKWLRRNKREKIQLYMEYALNSWFLLELIVRVIVSPSKYQFFKTPVNIIDTLAVVPYFIMSSIHGELYYHRILRTLRFVRIFRLFRLGRQSKRMKLVGKILVSTVDDIKELLLCLVIVIIFGGSIVFYAEMDRDKTEFKSIPDALWWAVQTVVVLGYGDIVPTTLLGKLFAAFFMVFGALTIALPVLSVVTKFSAIYATNINTD